MAGGEEFIIDITGKFTDETKGGIEKLDKELEAVQKKAKTYEKAISSVGTDAKSLKKIQTNLSSVLSQAQQKYSSAKSSADQYGTSMTDLQKKLKSLHANQRDVSAQIRETTTQLNAAKKAGNQAEITSLSKALDEHRASQKNVAKSIQETSSELDSATSKFAAYSQAAKNAGDGLQVLEKQNETLQEKLDATPTYQRVADGFQTASEKIGKVGDALTLGVTTPVLAAGAAAINTGIGFENAMSQVAGALNMPASQMGNLKQLALDMGQETIFSASEAAQAMTELAKGGMTEANIQGGALQSTMDLAASSGMNLADAANTVVQTMGAFDLSASRSGEAVNALAGAAAASSADVSDLTQGLSQVGTVAQNSGWDVQETTATLAAFADAGIMGSDAGTSLKTMLQRLTAPTDAAKKKMEELGISVRDSNDNLLSAQEIAQNLQDALSGLSSGDRDAALNEIFGSDAIRAAIVLANEGASGMQTYVDAASDADAASRMAESQMGDTGRAIEEMKGSIETAGITISEVLAPYVTKGAEAVTKLVNAFSELSDGAKGTILGVIGGTALAGPAIKTFSPLLSGISKIIKKVGDMRKNAKAVSSTAEAVTGSISGVSNATQTVTDAMASAAKSTSKWSSISSKLPGILGLVAAGVTATVVAVKAYHEYMVDLDKKEHFGNITLSAEEVADVADRLTKTEFTMKLDEIDENAEKVDNFRESLEDLEQSLDKTNWKASIGLELTVDEQEGFKSDVESYVQNALDMINQQHYTTSLAIDMVAQSGSWGNETLSKLSNTYYSSLESNFSDMGKKLSDAVASAFADGELSPDEVENITNKYLKPMQDAVDKFNEAQDEAKLNRIQQNTLHGAEGGLTPESFGDLMSAIGDRISSDSEATNNAAAQSMAELAGLKQQGLLSDSKYNDMMDYATRSANQQYATDSIGSVMKGYETLQQNYSKEISAVSDEFDSSMKSTLSELMNSDMWMTNLGSALKDVGTMNNAGIKTLTGYSQKNMQEITQSLDDDFTNQIYSYADDWFDAGQVPPKEFVNGMQEAFRTEMMSGNTTHAMDYAGMILGTNDDFRKQMEDFYKQNEGNVSEAFMQMIRGAEMSSGKIFEDGIFKDAEEATSLGGERLEELMRNVGIKAGSSLADALGEASVDVQTSIAAIYTMFSSGSHLNSDQVAQAFAGVGINLSDALAQELAAVEPEMQARVATLLATVLSGIQLDANSLGTVLSGFGVTLSNSLVDSLSGLGADVQRALINAVTSADVPTAIEQLKQQFPDNVTIQGLKVNVDATTGAVTLAGGEESIDDVIKSAAGDGGNITIYKNVDVVTKGMYPSKESANIESLTASFQQTVEQVIHANPDTAEAEQQLNETARDRETSIDVTLNGADEVSNSLDNLARDRYVNYYVNQTGSLDEAHNASGGIIKSKTLSWLAEEGWPEAVIPFDPARRTRAISLWEQTGEKLGVTPEAHADGGIVGGPGKLIPFTPPVSVEPAQGSAKGGASVTISSGAIQITVQANGSDANAIAATLNNTDIAEEIARRIARELNRGLRNTPNAREA